MKSEICQKCADKGCFGYDHRITECVDFQPMTNADCIRAMSDKELTEAIVHTYGNGGVCPPNHTHLFCLLDSGCINCWLSWLKNPVEENNA